MRHIQEIQAEVRKSENRQQMRVRSTLDDKARKILLAAQPTTGRHGTDCGRGCYDGEAK